MFNVYHAGFSRRDDFPPKRFMEEPIKSGPMKGEFLKEVDWNKMLDEYYGLHGWDPHTGWPTKKKLEELDLHACIAKLEQAKQVYL
jgi:aldehyde:ferredoxin oxidoreductase